MIDVNVDKNEKHITNKKEIHMSVEVIPSGSSVVVTNKDHDWARDAERVKDVLATMSSADGTRHANTLETIKDAEANLQEANGRNFMEVDRDVKDSEARLERSSGDRFMQVVQDVKDAEARLERSSGDRFIKTVEDIYHTDRDIWKSQGHVLETIKDVEFEGEKSRAKTREEMLNAFKYSDVRMIDEFRKTDSVIYNNHEKSQKTAFENEMRNLLQFKDQALLSEKLYAGHNLLSEKLAAHQQLLSEKLAAQAAKEAAECCCEIKQLIGADGQKTRDLINAQEVDRLREKNLRVENQLAAYYARNAAPVFP